MYRPSYQQFFMATACNISARVVDLSGGPPMDVADSQRGLYDMASLCTFSQRACVKASLFFILFWTIGLDLT